jgi:hypothetical protein
LNPIRKRKTGSSILAKNPPSLTRKSDPRIQQYSLYKPERLGIDRKDCPDETLSAGELPRYKAPFDGEIDYKLLSLYVLPVILQ